MTYLGIDPGAKGHLAILFEDGSVSFVPLTDKDLFRASLKSLSNDDCICCLEKVHAMPGQGVTSMFTFGEGFGYVKGVLDSFLIPYQEIQPQKWKKEFGLINAEKSKSVEVAKQLFPKVIFRTSDRCRVDNDNMSDALLMALYAKRKFLPAKNAEIPF